MAAPWLVLLLATALEASQIGQLEPGHITGSALSTGSLAFVQPTEPTPPRLSASKNGELPQAAAGRANDELRERKNARKGVRPKLDRSIENRHTASGATRPTVLIGVPIYAIMALCIGSCVVGGACYHVICVWRCCALGTARDSQRTLAGGQDVAQHDNISWYIKGQEGVVPARTVTPAPPV